MPIRFAYDPQLKILFTTAEGLVSFEEIQKHLDGEAYAGAIRYREIIDGSAASTSLNSDEVRQIVERVVAMMQGAVFGPTAIVTSNDVAFGMARMFAILCEVKGGPQVAVFKTASAGLDWLRTFPQ